MCMHHVPHESHSRKDPQKTPELGSQGLGITLSGLGFRVRGVGIYGLGFAFLRFRVFGI